MPDETKSKIYGASSNSYFKKLHSWKMPAVLHFEVTNRCNLRCSHCHQSHFNLLHGDMPLAMFFQVIEEIEPAISIGLSSSGEPLIAEHFDTMLEYALHRGHSVAFTTNGVQLGNKVQTLVGKNIGITLSMDGATEKVYQSIRGISNKQVLRNLEKLNALKEQSHTDKPALSLTMVLSRKNIEELPAVISLANHHKIKNVVAYHRVFYRGADFDKYSLYNYQDLSDQKHLEALKLAKEKKVNFFHTPFFHQGQDSNEFLQNVPTGYINKKDGVIFCEWIENISIIGWQGAVYACCHMDRLFMGNTRYNPFFDIWNGPYYRKLRLAHLNQTPPPKCEHECFMMQVTDSSNKEAFQQRVHESYLSMEEPIGPVPYSFRKADELYRKAIDVFEKSTPEKAIPILEHLVRMDENFFEALHLLGVCFSRLGQNELSSQHFSNAKQAYKDYEQLMSL